ncbi:hypothetical protein AQUCO_00700967v1 [Aquilegia coerulea]|uniref:Ribosomal RNA-processing protein 14/surfeit locus protein 6 C-terminal domain-containing protein n=1 Tax=Aquilegia coerulea TaxID=218851 RepID=A0A2G5EMJ1_AQUCA|nr:hypothetical protein AQUCO_00700967v1 [Aquilegia coerulea]
MKKRKQISSKPNSDFNPKSLIHKDSDCFDNLVEQIRQQITQDSKFFDNLVELIPSRFYLPVDDKQKPWFQGLSKAAKASAKKETKENIKKARLARLDPEKASTTLDLLKKSIDDEKKMQDSDDDDEEVEGKIEFENIGESNSINKRDDRAVTYEELRERLRRKIEQLRTKRNAEGLETPRDIKRREIREGKRKRSNEEDVKLKEEVEKKEKIEEEVSKATERLSFSHVKIGEEDEFGRKKKKKKLSKYQSLEEAKKLEEVKKDPELGKKFSWKTAADRAAGVKVHDDPKLINKSIKKDKKKHDKNVEKWKERIDSRDKVRNEKQQKRSGNIAERIQDKKNRRIAKREKKLMRPGFEGRKEGFITKS